MTVGIQIAYRPPSNKLNFPSVLSHLARSGSQPVQIEEECRERGGVGSGKTFVMYGAVSDSTAFLPPRK